MTLRQRTLGALLLITSARFCLPGNLAEAASVTGVTSLPPVVCDLNVAYTAASGVDEWPNALARLDIVSLLPSNLSSWVLVWTLNDAETLQGDSVVGALLVNPGGPGGQPARAINTLDNAPVAQGLAGKRGLSYQFTSSAAQPTLFAPTYVAVNGFLCRSPPTQQQQQQPANLSCGSALANCTPAWFCCGMQILSPPPPPAAFALPPAPLWIAVSAAPGPLPVVPADDVRAALPTPSGGLSPAVRLVPSAAHVISPRRKVAGIVAGAVAGAIVCVAAGVLVLRHTRRKAQAVDHGNNDDGTAQIPPATLSDGADATPAQAAVVYGGPSGALLRTRSLPVLLTRRASLKPATLTLLPTNGDEENGGGGALRRSSTLVTPLRRAMSSSTASTSDATIDLDFEAELELEALLGSGAFGAVYRARWSRLGGARVAVKMLHNVDGASALASFQSEVQMLQRLQHPNIVRFLGACLTPPNACLIEELVDGGSLHTFLHGDAGRPCTRSEFVSMVQDISSAMAYLHTIPVVHRDLKAQNVLLDGNARAKVCDFGLAKVKRHTFLSTLHGGVGTPAYMAPELFQGSGASEKVDVWAGATLLWEMLTGQVPWGHLTSPVQVIYAIAVQHERLPIPDDCPPQLAQLMRACWSYTPDDRPTFIRILDVVRGLESEAAG